MSKIYYIGDWAVQMGPVYAETPFNYAYKGLDFINYGKWLMEAFQAGGHECKSVPTWDFYQLGPGEFEKVLDEYDIIVFSDVEAKNFQLAPSFFDRHKFGTKVLTFPDRIRLTVDAVKRGRHVMFLGGWLSFNGELGKGGWGRTGLREILPVECMEFEDLRESTEGFTAEIVSKDHPIAKHVSLQNLPPILGYNRVNARANCPVICNWSGSTDPMLAVGQFGKGRTLAYTSDPAPHWGCNFVFWDQYARFWNAMQDWLTGKLDR